jgi:hypothetical protein
MLWQQWSQQGLNAMGKLVADIIVETLQNAGVAHCYGVVGDTLNPIARLLEKRNRVGFGETRRSGSIRLAGGSACR